MEKMSRFNKKCTQVNNEVWEENVILLENLSSTWVLDYEGPRDSRTPKKMTPQIPQPNCTYNFAYLSVKY